MMNFFPILDHIDSALNRRLQESMVFITPFAILIAIACPIFFIILYPTEKIWLDSGMALTSIGILLVKHLSYFKQRYLAIYWFFLLLFCFPINFIYGLLEQPQQTGYISQQLFMSIVLIMIIKDWLILLLIIILGAYFAIVIHSHSFFNLSVPKEILSATLPYVISIVITMIFVRKIRQSINSGVKKQILLNEQVRALQSFGASFSHELRTPLMVIHNLALSHRHIISPIVKEANSNKLRKIERYSALINRQSAIISHFVNRHLLNFKTMQAQTEKHMITYQYSILSMNTCIDRCLALPDFKQALQKHQLIWHKSEDITFLGEAILVEYCLESLLKLGLSVIDKGVIHIKVQTRMEQHHVVIEYHNTAISSDIVQTQLTQFFSEYNQGIGLAFCCWAMKSMWGKIEYIDSNNQLIKLILYFPKT